MAAPACPLRSTTRYFDKAIRAGYGVVDNIPAIEFTPSPVISPVAACLQVVWEIRTILARRNTTVISAPITRAC